MGILDDAIREHLELKRAHGASEEELRQQEVEALGAPPGARRPRTSRSAPRRTWSATASRPTATVPRRWRRRCRGGAGGPRGARPAEPEPEPEPLAQPEPEAVFDEPEGDRRSGAPDTPARGFAALEEEDDEAEAALRGRAPMSRGHAGLPPGDAGARPALVRAEAAARLRLRLDGDDLRSGRRSPQRKLQRGSPAPATPRLMQLSGVPCRLCSTEPSMPSCVVIRPRGRKPEILRPGLNARPVRRCSRARWTLRPRARCPARRPPRAARRPKRASGPPPRGTPCA